MANTVRKAGIRPLPLVLVIVLFASGTIFALSLREATATAWLIDKPLKVTLFLSGVLALVSACILITGLAAQCPRCKRWWGKVELEREVVERRQSQKVVTLRTDYKDNRGMSRGHSNREELRLVTIERHRCHNQCRACGHKWTSYETVQT